MKDMLPYGYAYYSAVNKLLIFPRSETRSEAHSPVL